MQKPKYNETKKYNIIEFLSKPNTIFDIDIWEKDRLQYKDIRINTNDITIDPRGKIILHKTIVNRDVGKTVRFRDIVAITDHKSGEIKKLFKSVSQSKIDALNKEIYEEKEDKISYYIEYEEYYKRYRFRKIVNKEGKNLNKNDRHFLVKRFLKKYKKRLDRKHAYSYIDFTKFSVHIQPPAHAKPIISFSFDFKEIITLHKLMKELYKIQNEDSGNFKHYASNTDFVMEIIKNSKYYF